MPDDWTDVVREFEDAEANLQRAHTIRNLQRAAAVGSILLVAVAITMYTLSPLNNPALNDRAITAIFLAFIGGICTVYSLIYLTREDQAQRIPRAQRRLNDAYEILARTHFLPEDDYQ